MVLSIIFSGVIYQVATNEVGARLERFQSSIQQIRGTMPQNVPTEMLRENEVTTAQDNLSVELIYVNLVILICGGFASYLLAKWHIAPIERAHEAESRFTSDASHELRTPLAIMKTELEVALRDKNATVDDLKEILSSNLEEVDKLTKLAEMLLNLSRLDQEKMNQGPINLTKLSKITIRDFGQIQSRIKLKSDKQLTIYGNETAIADLIKIFLDNATQYSPKDSEIDIEIYHQDNHARFDITNKGKGIEPDKLTHIFERFYRVDSSRTNGCQRGYGLGLSLAQKIVELHNGQITATSIPDQTTTFSFMIPLHANHQAKSQS
jgi:signal transduction histidine kinase